MTIKIVDTNPPEPTKFKYDDLEIGEVVQGRILNAHTGLFLKTYACIVNLENPGAMNLENPGATWNKAHSRPLLEGHKVDIEIKVLDRKKAKSYLLGYSPELHRRPNYLGDWLAVSKDGPHDPFVCAKAVSDHRPQVLDKDFRSNIKLGAFSRPWPGCVKVQYDPDYELEDSDKENCILVDDEPRDTFAIFDEWIESLGHDTVYLHMVVV